MLRTRTLQLPGLKTSVALERVFWQTIDALSEGEWQDWVKEKLKAKPKSVGRASYLRQLAHQAVLNETQLNA
ncbi:MAG: ribbon-helix-helix domain-containing protein [Proteobacteria bacterium]|nr:ribbon-helix-helix domain-containing protein [Pseudomonadota bacterium]MDA0896204.1 ribbon-helix-helix domain-containing protein [Pseudomonadota bacterium]